MITSDLLAEAGLRVEAFACPLVGAVRRWASSQSGRWSMRLSSVWWTIR